MTDTRAALKQLGERFIELDQLRNAALADLGAAMRAADGEVSVTEMAEFGGVSRVTVYRLLGRPRK